MVSVSGSGSPARGFTLVELLVVIAIISILAGFLVPTLIASRDEAYKVQCASNLRQIAQMSMLYADNSGSRFFPCAKGNAPAAHESLNLLVAFLGSARKLDPTLFVCPNWRGSLAEVDSSGRYELDEHSCSYAWAQEPLSPTDGGMALGSDKHVRSETERSGHPGGMNVVYTDCSVRFVPEAELGEGGLPEGLRR